MVRFLCTFIYQGIELQEIMEANHAVDCVLSLAEDGASAIRVQPMAEPA